MPAPCLSNLSCSKSVSFVLEGSKGYVLSYSKPFGLLPKVCPQEHSKMSFQPLKKI